jgi:hypothetical protein
MSTQEHFRQFADECLAWAQRARSERERQQFLDMAKLWMTAAQQLDDATPRTDAPPLAPRPMQSEPR